MKNTLDLNKMGLEQMDAIEMRETKGGFNWLGLVTIVLGLFGLGGSIAILSDD